MGRYADKTARMCIGVLAFLFWVSAVALLYAVYFIIILYKNYKPFFLDFYILFPSGFAGTGAVFLIVNGLLGFKILKKGSRCQQGTFMYFIVVLLCLLSTGLVLAYVYINRMDHELRPMLNAFQQYNDSNYGIVNKIQNELHCCGLQNYTDWETTSWYKRSDNHSVPKSCCNVAFSACFGILTESNKLYQEGCFVKLHHKLTFFLIWLFWSGITIICVEILAAVFDGILMTRNPFQDFRILDSGVFA
ncbi:tetraspanin-3-like isoform X1 [Mixophyes fleayi]|uniref:tetraspanin-3-like isoform X1 n=1 Tax=Mixophyes fleayi TaxID=3061075 RepID=UPI003F4E2869